MNPRATDPAFRLGCIAMHSLLLEQVQDFVPREVWLRCVQLNPDAASAYVDRMIGRSGNDDTPVGVRA
jgi:hypothetical protein